MAFSPRAESASTTADSGSSAPTVTLTLPNGGELPKSVKRDEIFEVKLKITPAQNITFLLTVTPEQMGKQTLGSRGEVQMYDFGVSEKGVVTSVNSIDLKESANGEKTFKVVFNKAGAVQIAAHEQVCGGNLSVTSAEIQIIKRIRQYASAEEKTFNRVNNFDAAFDGAAALWPDWRYGRGAGNFLFKDGAAPYDGELLKAICFKESFMNADQARINSVATDIMQVNAGDSHVLDTMNNVAGYKQYDWNANAHQVLVTYADDNTNHWVYLVQERNVDPPPLNSAGVYMHYQTHAPGPASVATEQASIKWAVRELLFKQYNLRTVFKERNLVGKGVTLVAEEEPPAPELIETLNRYGTGQGKNYGADILKIRDEGRGLNTATDFIWPIKCNKKARH